MRVHVRGVGKPVCPWDVGDSDVVGRVHTKVGEAAVVFFANVDDGVAQFMSVTPQSTFCRMAAPDKTMHTSTPKPRLRGRE